MIVFEPLMKELATRGHQVTVVSAFPLDKTKDNYTDIKLDIPDITKITSDQVLLHKLYNTSPSVPS
ncbi:unnamed protein product [Timema podura]|uniref:Uncharacterized protein n=1 Tax=Timema podura TaxID=61482 RepID=A0ABN7P1Q4_TIMPD|nr:unnamed protein product [Timema podura]